MSLERNGKLEKGGAMIEVTASVRQVYAAIKGAFLEPNGKQRWFAFCPYHGTLYVVKVPHDVKEDGLLWVRDGECLPMWKVVNGNVLFRGWAQPTPSRKWDASTYPPDTAEAHFERIPSSYAAEPCYCAGTKGQEPYAKIIIIPDEQEEDNDG
jgi:hypothetical protein